MTKLTFSKKTKILTLAAGIMLSLAFLFGFVFFIVSKSPIAVSWGLMFPLFLLFFTLSLCGIREAFFSYCLFDDEKGKVLKNLYFIARILKWSGALIAVFFAASLFLSVKLIPFAFIICAGYPILLFLIMFFAKGEIRFNAKDTDLYPNIFSPFCYCSASLCIMSVSFVKYVYSFSKLFSTCTIIMVITFFLYFLCASKAEKNISKKLSGKILNFASLMLFMYIYAFGFTTPANIIFDKSNAKVYQASVINERVSKGKHTNYYLELSPWIDEKISSKEISVGENLYAEVEKGDTVTVKLYKGFLDIPWFKVSKDDNGLNK